MAIWLLEDNDERIKTFVDLFPDIIIHKTSKSFIKDLKANNKPGDILYLDHDLGKTTPEDPNCGMDVVRFLEEKHLPLGHIFVHSFNSYASRVMVARLRSCRYSSFLQSLDNLGKK